MSCVAILYLAETQAPKQVLLSAHSEVRDIQGTLRLPNGFYVHHLPTRDQVYVEVQPAHSLADLKPDAALMPSLRRALTAISRPFFYPVADSNAEKQWSLLEALALDQDPPNLNPPPEEYPEEIAGDIEKLRAICESATSSLPAPKAKRIRKK